MDGWSGTTSEERVFSWFILLSGLAVAENTGTSVMITQTTGEHLELSWVQSTGFIQEFLLELPHQGEQLCFNFILPQLYSYLDISFQDVGQPLGVIENIPEAEVQKTPLPVNILVHRVNLVFEPSSYNTQLSCDVLIKNLCC